MLTFMEEQCRNRGPSLVAYNVDPDEPNKIFLSDKSMDISNGSGIYNAEIIRKMPSCGFVIGDRVQPAPISSVYDMVDAIHRVLVLGQMSLIYRLSYIKMARVNATGDILYCFQLEDPVTGTPLLAGWIYRDLMYKDPDEIQIEFVDPWKMKQFEWVTYMEDIHTEQACAQVESWVTESIEAIPSLMDLNSLLNRGLDVYQIHCGFIVYDYSKDEYRVFIRYSSSQTREYKISSKSVDQMISEDLIYKVNQ